MVGASIMPVFLIPMSIVVMENVTTTRIATHVRAIAVHVLTVETVSVTGVRTAMRVLWTVVLAHTAVTGNATMVRHVTPVIRIVVAAL